MRTLLILLVLGISAPLMSQSAVGIWKNETNGEVQSHIEVYEKDGHLYAKVIKLFPHTEVTHCQNCKDELAGVNLLDVHIFYDLGKKGKKWTKGKILDPESGKVYGCNVELKSPNRLKIRGYVGKPLFGKTFYWDRVL